MGIETNTGIEISHCELEQYLKVLKNKIYKLLPLREEGAEWERYLDSVKIEVSGLSKLIKCEPSFISLIAKLESLSDLEEFVLYRKTIFECLNEIEEING